MIQNLNFTSEGGKSRGNTQNEVDVEKRKQVY